MWKRLCNIFTQKIFTKSASGSSSGSSSGSGDEPLPPQALLLVHAACADGEMTSEERVKVLSLVRKSFGLAEPQAEALVARAQQEEAHASDIFRWTEPVNKSLTEAQKRQLIEHLWEVTQADGHVDDFERNLLRRVAGLLHISDKDSALARRRARSKAHS